MHKLSKKRIKVERRAGMSSRVVRALTTLVVCLSALPALAACRAAPAPSDVNVVLKSFSITPSSPVAKAGTVTFHVKNEASDDTHEFVVILTTVAADQLPLDADGNVDEAATGNFGTLGELGELKAGTARDFTVSLAPGHYVLICNISGHYKSGMHADLNVTP